MKKTFLLILAVTITLFTVFAIGVFAADQTEAVKFTVTSEDGTVKNYYKESDFVTAVSGAQNNDKITLCSNIMIDTGISIIGSAASPKNVTLDLAGFGVASVVKITVFRVATYATLNVYSSKPDAYLYVAGPNGGSGGNMFAIQRNGARVNFGDMTIDGVTYPGSNITTFSSCFIDVRYAGADGFYGNGGTHYANVKDWAGFICARTGEGKVELRSSNIIVHASNSLFYNEETTNSFLIENCVIINLQSKQEAIFKSTVNCPITIKDCFTNYCLTSSSQNKTEGIVTLIGENIFGTENEMDKTLIVGGGDGLTVAKTNAEIKLVDGGYDSWYFDDVGSFNKIKLYYPDATSVGVVTSEENTTLYTWNYNNESTTELWCNGITPETPYKLPNVRVEGMYKYAWTKTVNPDGSIVYNGGKVADFDICISAVYNGTLTFRVYIPAYVIDEGYLLYNDVLIAGAAYYASEWQSAEVNGEDYYYVETLSIDNERFNTPFEVVLPCDFPEGKGQSTFITTTWMISPELYISRVLESTELYEADSVDVVKEIASVFMNTDNTEE